MFSNITKVLLSNFWVAILGLINGFVFPKAMSIDEYSIFQTYSLYLSYIGILSLGLPTGMFINYGGCDYKLINRKQYKSEIRLLVIILFFFTCLGAIAYIIAGSEMILFITLSIFPYCTVGSYQALYQSWNRFKDYSILNATLPTLICVLSLGIYFVTGQLLGFARITVNIGVYAFITFILVSEYVVFTKKVKSMPIFSAKNIDTLKVGFLISIGNFACGVLSSIDKQFIKIFYNNFDFAMYSFGISMQVLMNVFISAIAQPLYLKLATSNINRKMYNEVKEILFMFGSLSGCAYFVCSFVVTNFLPKYLKSLDIISIYFAVFPAYAVIIGLYVNLYKITRQTKKYIKSVVLMLATALILNSVAIKVYGGFQGVAVATLITYYVWLFYSCKDFISLSIERKDILYLVLFLSLFFSSTKLFGSIIGFFAYLALDLMISFLIYGSTIISYGTLIKTKFLKR